MAIVYRGRVFSVEVGAIALPNGTRARDRDRPAPAVGRADSDARRRARRADPPVSAQRRARRSGSCRPAASIPANRRRPRQRASAKRRSRCVPAASNACASFYPAPGFCDEELIFFRVSDLQTPPRRLAAQAGRRRGHPRADIHRDRGTSDGGARRDRRLEDRVRPHAGHIGRSFTGGKSRRRMIPVRSLSQDRGKGDTVGLPRGPAIDRWSCGRNLYRLRRVFD